jgi:Uma2 family endonuclease
MSTILKLTITEYDRWIERGLFEGLSRRRIELIHGELREMSPAGPFHEALIRYLTRWSVKNASENFEVSVQCGIALDELESVPEPDIAWVQKKNYRRRRPKSADVVLIIEIADSSRDYDLGEKLALYAEAGIQEYWVVNVPKIGVDVFRNPGKRRYRVHKCYSTAQSISPLAAPEAVLNVAELFSE